MIPILTGYFLLLLRNAAGNSCVNHNDRATGTNSPWLLTESGLQDSQSFADTLLARKDRGPALFVEGQHLVPFLVCALLHAW